MDNFMQQQTRMRQRKRQKHIEMQEGAPFLGVISGSHNPDSEKVSVTYHAGLRKLSALHPYIGSDSWIRVGAESGQSVIMAQRPDSDEPELLAYADKSEHGAVHHNRIELFNKKIGVYRPLTAGEIEVHSTGLAQSHYSRRPLLEQRAGLVRSWLNQDELQAGAKSPVHVRNLHLHKNDAIGDEERWGVVQRPDGSTFKTIFVSADRQPDPDLTASVVQRAATDSIIVEQGPFAKEHLRILKTGALFPEKLLDIREGDVIDDEGNQVNLSLTGEPLRYKAEWFTDDERGGAFFVGIDNLGNFAVAAPDEAETGGDIKIPMGDLVIYIGVNETVTVQTDYSRTTVDGQMTIDCKTDYTKDIREGNKTETIHQGNVEQTVIEGTYTQTVKSDHTVTVEDGNMTIAVDTGDQETTVEGNQDVTVTGDITITSSAAIHLIVGGTEVHIEDGLIELGAEGSGDIAVLDSLLQDELKKIKKTIKKLKDEVNKHVHPRSKYLMPLIPAGMGPVVKNKSGPKGAKLHSSTKAKADYEVGDTASGLVMIDS